MELKILLLLAYLGVFWTLCFRWPHVALGISFAISPFVANVTGSNINLSLADLNILMCVPLVLLSARGARNGAGIGPLSVPVTVYLIISLAASVIASQWDSTITSWLQMVLYFVAIPMVYANLVKTRDLSLFPYYAVVGGTAWALIGFATNFDFMGSSKNSFGASLAGAGLVNYALYLVWKHKPREQRKQWEGRLMMACGLIIAWGLFQTLSRGAWLGAIMGFVAVSLYARSYKMMLSVAMVILPLGIVGWWLLPPNLQTYVFNFDASAVNIGARYKSLATAQEYFYRDPIWGSGLGLRKVYDATNVIWSTLAETGIIGLLAFVAIFATFYGWTWKLTKKLDITDVRTIIVLMGVGLVTSRLGHGMVDHFWSRGILTMAGASIGLIYVVSRSLQLYPNLLTQRALRSANWPSLAVGNPIARMAPQTATFPPTHSHQQGATPQGRPNVGRRNRASKPARRGFKLWKTNRRQRHSQPGQIGGAIPDKMGYARQNRRPRRRRF